MNEFMQSHPEYMTSTNAEGVNRVENENYAFLMESTTIEYITERRCSLTQVGSLLDEKGYGIAMRKNWPYRDILSQAVLELQEQGILTKMKTKWWKEKRGGGACADKKADGAEELGMPNVGGVYVVLFIGCVTATCYGILEWICHIYATARQNKVPFKAELMDEIRFVMQCSGNTKPAKYPKASSSKSSAVSKRSSSSLSANSMTSDDQQLQKRKSIK
uniref:Ionotropic glutamate receptor C-terminal domain-containing protein n=2 Tax=Stomoxys calcitrans TaxID=35570 RepID=A0A1I8PDV3_STOCA